MTQTASERISQERIKLTVHAPFDGLCRRLTGKYHRGHNESNTGNGTDESCQLLLGEGNKYFGRIDGKRFYIGSRVPVPGR